MLGHCLRGVCSYKFRIDDQNWQSTGASHFIRFEMGKPYWDDPIGEADRSVGSRTTLSWRVCRSLESVEGGFHGMARYLVGST